MIGGVRAKRRFSLFWRLTGIISLVLLAGAAALTFAAWSYARVAADNAYDRLLVGAARQISETVSADAGAVTVDVPTSALETLSISRSDRVYYQVALPDGAIITGYPDLPLPQASQEPSDAAVVGDGEFLGHAIRIASVWRYLAEQGATGWVRITVAQTREARNALSLELALSGFLAVVGMSILALAAFMGAVRLGLRPLRLLQNELARRDPNDLRPLEVETPLEVDALVETINRFMARLSERLGSMQRYIETAAHQLRTPLTGISAQVEMLDRAHNGQGRAAATARLRRRVGEMGRLANQLLSHATIIHRAEAVLAEIVDLAQIARNGISDATLETIERDLTVRVDVPDEPVLVLGDAIALREALRNLVENALAYGAPSRLAVRLTRTDKTATLAVIDDGGGIAPVDWERLRARYVRGGTEGTGSGLGLAIVSDVARTHGAQLDIFTEPGGDFGIALTVPLAEAQ
ncbi:sensor histidine kinase [Pelagibacterium halotolerans]|uniref:histidine kinase n=1 Tax=Pelagibacterium halotolerans (strain DSM 22347 / JCM 15775 / CGMCC 1.7692 / B2) TaxID=1082931 RepID=G4RD40_PELHB|nr:sensor histidine kinase [Pelagibacterium halotolerans]AEQ53790.1 two component system histidine kinase [Pelagibacterium halotolerans B2]QJR20052.1 sensor histidine kinase [Pelagibacterium halotolerans]SEA81072.1 two-component system, OmpR family, sensor histidine kinase TctE [Pelagibacterium halotolerans]